MASMHIKFEISEFLPVGHLKTLVYAAPVDNEEACHPHILDACHTI
jgi:hypothetical protein